MTKPLTYLVRMLVFLVVVAAVTALLGPTLIAAFNNNPLLDGLILGVLALGILWNLVTVARLNPEVRWLETLRHPRAGLAPPPSPKLLAPMASMIASRNRSDRLTLSTPAMRSLLDSLSSRLDESRELSRYMIGLLIFLGLLGTFYGLLLTVSAISEVIANLSISTGDVNLMFDQLKSGLARPLHGMGTAFSGSMFGLAGALVLGFLDLTAGQAQNRFFNELEEWLAGITRFSGGFGGEGEAPMPHYVQALLEQTAENLDGLQTVLSRNDEARSSQTHTLNVLSERIGDLAEMMRTNQSLMQRVAEGQAALVPVLRRLAEAQDSHVESDSSRETREHMRAIERLLGRMLSENEQGRVQSTTELRGDIRLLTRTLAAIGGSTTA